MRTWVAWPWASVTVQATSAMGLAVKAMAIWPAVLMGDLALPTAFPVVAWHAHELVFGFTGAVMAGFLLTAIPNWTGCRPYSGAKLAGLAALFR